MREYSFGIVTDSFQSVLENAITIAGRYDADYIASEQLVYAMLQLKACIACRILEECGVNEENYLVYFSRVACLNVNMHGLTPLSMNILRRAAEIAQEAGGEGTPADTEHLLRAIIEAKNSLAMKILRVIPADMDKLISLTDQAIHSKRDGDTNKEDTGKEDTGMREAAREETGTGESAKEDTVKAG